MCTCIYRHGNCTPVGIYMHQLSSQHAPRCRVLIGHCDFEHSVPVQCHIHEQINTAYRTKIVQGDGSFCDENCRSWMDIEWNQLEIREFFFDSAKASGCRSTPTVGPHVRFGWWFRKLAEPGKRYCIVCQTELCYADRGAVFFHETCQS